MFNLDTERHWTQGRLDRIRALFGLDGFINGIHFNDLQPNKMLHDAIINEFLRWLLFHRVNTARFLFHQQALSSWVYPQYMDGADINPNADVVVMPINRDGTHWLFVAIYPKADLFVYCDSHPEASIDGNEVIDRVKIMLEKTFPKKRFQAFETHTAPQPYRRARFPKQDNINDSGVFLCAGAMALFLDQPINFSSEDIPRFRYEMADVLIDYIASTMRGCGRPQVRYIEGSTRFPVPPQYA